LLPPTSGASQHTDHPVQTRRNREVSPEPAHGFCAGVDRAGGAAEGGWVWGWAVWREEPETEKRESGALGRTDHVDARFPKYPPVGPWSSRPLQKSACTRGNGC
jgi:hypothetical protein